MVNNKGISNTSKWAKALYHEQRLCKAKTRKGSKCGNIALVGLDYCRFHTTTPKAKRLELKQQQAIAQGKPIRPRYTMETTTQRKVYHQNLANPQLLDLSNEVALLQGLLQDLINKAQLPTANQTGNLTLQLQVIDRLEKLVSSINRKDAQLRADERADERVKLVVNKVAIVINNIVKDASTRQAIAKELLHLAQEDTTSPLKVSIPNDNAPLTNLEANSKEEG